MPVMDPVEIVNDPLWAVQQAIEGMLREHFKMLPVIVQSGDGHTMVAQSAIAFNVTQPDGSVKPTNMAPINAPIKFAGGGGVTATHPVTQGDEGCVIFADRNHDAWHQKGGENNAPVDARTHNPSDAHFIPGGRSDPRKLNPAPSSTSHQTRSDDGNHVSDVHPQNGVSHASTAKVSSIAGGASGSGTLHVPGSLIKNASRILMNSVQIPGFPSPGQTIAGNLAVATKPLGAIGPMAAAIASKMTSILSGGAGAVMANPVAAATSALSGAVTGGAASLTSALGGAAASTVAALTGGSGLATALASLTTHTNNISGVSVPTGGAPGLSDVLNHADAVNNYFGSSPPSSVAISSVIAPLDPATPTAMLASVNSIVAQVLAGTMSDASGAAAINAITAQANALVTNSTGAISTLMAAIPAMSNAMAVASAASSLNPAMNALSSALATAGSQMASLTSAAQAAVAPTPSEIGHATSFPDASAGQQGATGGF